MLLELIVVICIQPSMILRLSNLTLMVVLWWYNLNQQTDWDVFNISYLNEVAASLSLVLLFISVYSITLYRIFIFLHLFICFAPLFPVFSICYLRKRLIASYSIQKKDCFSEKNYLQHLVSSFFTLTDQC